MTRGGYVAFLALGSAAIALLAHSAEGATVVPTAVLQWQALAEKYAGVYSILDPEEILAVIWNESTGNPMSQNPGDPSWGLMGVTALIAKAYGGYQSGDYSWHSDPEKNINAGAGYLADLKRKYSAAHPLEWVDAYNVGETHFNAGGRTQSYIRDFAAHLGAIVGQQAG